MKSVLFFVVCLSMTAVIAQTYTKKSKRFLNTQPPTWPTQSPTKSPTIKPTHGPTASPTIRPTQGPTGSPSRPTEIYECGLTGDPHVRSFHRVMFSHYEIGTFTVFQKGNLLVQTLQARSTTWGSRSSIHALTVTSGEQTFAVSVDQQSCATTGNLQAEQTFGDVKIKWVKECNDKVGDRLLNVYLTYKSDQGLEGVSGVCTTKTPPNPLTWEHVVTRSKENCGDYWEQTLNMYTGKCGSSENLGCILDGIFEKCWEPPASTTSPSSMVSRSPTSVPTTKPPTTKPPTTKPPTTNKGFKCKLRGDPHVTSFYGKKFNHYKTGKFTAFKNGNIVVHTLQGRSKSWGRRSTIHAIYAQVGSKKYAVTINQKNCKTSGNLKRKLVAGPVTLSWQPRCGRKRNDRHFNLRITYAAANLKSVSGVCVKKSAPKLTYAHVVQVAKRKCRGLWSTTLKWAKSRCKSNRHVGCLLDRVRRKCSKTRFCCKARTAKCLACAKGLSVRKYCKKHSRTSPCRVVARKYIKKARAASQAARLDNYNARTLAAKARRYQRSARKLKSKAHRLRRRVRTHRKRAQYHGKAATRAAKQFRAMVRKARAQAGKSKSYSNKIKKHCRKWKRLELHHARRAASHYRKATRKLQHLRESKKYHKMYLLNAKKLARQATKLFLRAAQDSRFAKHHRQRARSHSRKATHHRKVAKSAKAVAVIHGHRGL